jgi:uncharacterized membrane protein
VKRATDTTRLEAFSDGVFAIAITLLILEIKVPTAAELERGGGLWPALAHRWPSYVGYVLSFLIIGIMWANHHALFDYIRRVDRRLIFANLLLLMGVGFLPFPTAVLAEHLADAETRTSAAVFYGATLAGIALAFNAVWWVGIRGRGLLGTSLDEAGVRTITRRYALGPVSYAAATAVALVNVWMSLAMHFALALLYARSERRDPESDRPALLQDPS